MSEELSLLGRPVKGPVRKLETFPNRHPGRGYTVTLTSAEFTAQCPLTGQPDFATLTIRYSPGAKILESKSLKLYLWSYRGEGIFHEHVVNVILDDLVAVLEPRWCEVTGEFAVRGGIAIKVEARYDRPGERFAPGRPPEKREGGSATGGKPFRPAPHGRPATGPRPHRPEGERPERKGREKGWTTSKGKS